MTPEELQQIEQLMRVGCTALQAGKPLEESQQYGATTLALIEKLKTLGLKPETTTRKKR